MVASQQALWARIEEIKRQVNATIGRELSYAFRSTNTYQSYTGLCGEAQYAFEDGDLTEELVTELATYAQKIIALYRENPQHE